MFDILSITAPIYLVIAVGFLCTRAGLFDKAALRAFGSFVLRLALPCLLFNAVATRRPAELLNAPYLLAYTGGSLLVLGAGLWWGRRVARLSSTGSVYAAMGMSCSNSGYVGFPILMLTLPSVAGMSLALNMVLENLIIIPLLLALAERAAAPQTRSLWWQSYGRTMVGLLRNPLIIALLAGLVCAVAGLQLPAFLTRTITLFAQASSTVSLFVIGGTLVGLPLAGLSRQALPIVLGKLLGHPLAVGSALLLLAALGLPVQDPLLREAALVMAAMPVMGIYPILAQRHGEEGVSAAAQLGTTVGSFLTLNLLLWALRNF